MPRASDSRIILLALGLLTTGLAVALVGKPPGPVKATPRLRRDFGYGSGVAFSPDGATLAAGRNEGTVALFAVADLGGLGEPHSIGVADEQFSKFRSGPGPILFSTYKQFCTDNGYRPLGRNKFYDKMVGLHGSLAPVEQLVPLLEVRS